MGDFREVISQITITDGLQEGDDIQVVTNTPVVYGEPITLFDMGTIDYQPDILEALGVGVIQYKDNTFLYDAYPQHDDDRDGMLKVRVFHQLTNPSFDDKQLEELLLDNRAGALYLKMIEHKDVDPLLDRLKAIFDSKKGNVVFHQFQ